MSTSTDENTRPVYPRGKHPNTLAALRSYKPGQNGHGRVYPLKERLAHALDHPLKEPKPDAPAGDLLVYATLKAALEIVPVAFRETWDRIEGKQQDTPPPPQGNRIIQIIVSSDKAKELTENVANRFLSLAGEQTPEG